MELDFSIPLFSTITLEETIALAKKGHEGQFRFDGITPFWMHLFGVASMVSDADPMVDEKRKARWMHDYLEDVLKVKNKEDIEKAIVWMASVGFGRRVITTTVLLTRLPDVPYEIYLIGVKADPWARDSKIDDMLYNLGDSPSPKQVKKYAKGIKFLLS